MKPSDFIVEGIGEDADAMHKDHEVQLARQDCYNAAKNAIELHKLLASVTEQEGLEGWISQKLTLAADYLNTVKEHLEYERRAATHLMMPEFTFESAEAQMGKMLENDEFAPSNRAATSVATHNWRRGGEISGTGLKGYVTTTFDHIKSVLGDPMYGPTNDPYDKVTCQWVLTFKDGTVASIYDYKTGKTPMGEYRWHIGGKGKAVEYVTHLLGLEAEDMYEEGVAEGTVDHRALGKHHEEMTDQELRKVGSKLPDSWDAAVFRRKLASHPKYAQALKHYDKSEYHFGKAAKQGVAEGKQPVSEMTAGGCSAGGFATGPTGGGTFKKTTGVPKKVKNTLRRVSPKIGTGIYK